MDASLRNTTGLINKIERLRDELIKHFDSIVRHAAINRPDRTTTAITQYQIQVETVALIRAAEDFQSLIRQLQEMWLFGQLDTVGESEARKQTDENAQVVADLLQELLDRRKTTSVEEAATKVQAVDGEDQAMSDGHE